LLVEMAPLPSLIPPCQAAEPWVFIASLLVLSSELLEREKPQPPRSEVTSALGPPPGYAGALRQQFGHDPARGAHTGLGQDGGIAFRCSFRHRARLELT